MKRKTDSVRSRKFTIRLSPEEFERLQKKFQSTIHRKLSDYLRQLVLEKPVTVLHRNQSLDDFLALTNRLKNELETCGCRFEEAIKNLQNLRDTGQLKIAIEYYQAEQFSLLQKAEEIRLTLLKIYQLWLPK